MKIKHNILITKYEGFTLIELLIVISIIGILAALITVSFVASQRQARDTQRKSDLAQYRTALEAFANANNGLYPFAGGNGLTPMSTVCSAALTTYIASCPTDPSASGRAYYYRSYNGTGNVGDATTTKYFMYVWGSGLESDNTKTWAVCSNGKSGQLTNDFNVVQTFCQ